MANSNRIERINSEIQKILGKLISEEIKDEVVHKYLVTIVGVRTSSDLSHAKVFVSVLAPDSEQNEVFFHVKHAEGFLQRRLAEIMDIRKVPEIDLVYDESMEQGQRVLNIIEQLKKGTK